MRSQNCKGIWRRTPKPEKGCRELEAYASCAGKIHAVAKGSAGLRIIYYCFLSEQQIWLLTLYDKNEAADLTKDEREVLRRALEAERAARKVGNKE